MKGIIPFFDTCQLRSHVLHNCASNSNDYEATIKNKDRKKDFHDAGLRSPPDPVISR